MMLTVNSSISLRVTMPELLPFRAAGLPPARRCLAVVSTTPRRPFHELVNPLRARPNPPAGSRNLEPSSDEAVDHFARRALAALCEIISSPVDIKPPHRSSPSTFGPR